MEAFIPLVGSTIGVGMGIMQHIRSRSTSENLPETTEGDALRENFITGASIIVGALFGEVALRTENSTFAFLASLTTSFGFAGLVPFFYNALRNRLHL